MRRRVDLSATIANAYRKFLPELRARIAAETRPEQRARLEGMLAEMQAWLEEYDAAGPQ